MFDVYYYIGERLKLEGETENMGVCTNKRKGHTAKVLMANLCTNSLGGESRGQKHGGDEGRKLCWKFATVSWSDVNRRAFGCACPSSQISKKRDCVSSPGARVETASAATRNGSARRNTAAMGPRKYDDVYHKA